MKILAIETATESCSVALQYGDEVLHRFEHQPQQQAKLILPMIDELMSQAGLHPSQLDALSFGRGPGSFTGLRIAAATTQAIAMACDLPTVPVSTLAVLAQTAYRQYGTTSVLAAIDARMQEVYWAEYCLGVNGLMQLQGEEEVLSPALVPVPQAANYCGCGSGWRSYAEALSNSLVSITLSVESDCWPQAQDMLALSEFAFKAGEVVSAEKIEPVYIRDKVAKSLAERRSKIAC